MNDSGHTEKGLKRESILAALADFSDRIQAAENYAQLSKLTLETITRLVKSSLALISIYDLEKNRLILEENTGAEIERKEQPRIALAQNITEMLDEGWEILGPSPTEINNFYVLYDPDLNNFYVEFRIPFFIKEELVAVISLSKKESGTDYTVEEIDILRVLANYISLVSERISEKSKSVSATRPRPFQKLTYQYVRQDDYSEILGESEAIRQIIRIIDKVAKENVPVLISGESGTGKELVARAIHRKSKRSEKPLVAMNCAALPDALVESELFGHERGAFTGATCQKKGKFEFADESTLFLDEIGDMSMTTQAKLLRVLQDGTFQRVGGNQTLHSDVRLIAATNKDLIKNIDNGTFRQDLYYRINVVQIEIPPLRERKQDVLLLAEYFFHVYNNTFNKDLVGQSSQVIDWLQEYPFPGNVRELKNVMERAVILETENVVTLSSMPKSRRKAIPTPFFQPSSNNHLSLEDLEKRHIEAVLKETGFNKSAAARQLGIARKTLREKIEKYHIKE
jgi:Nif-specific regulatory protein